MIYLTVFVVICLVSIGTASTVTTDDGEIQGFAEKVGDRTINTYLGIPYGLPPVGNLRFSRPQPAKPWEGVLQALTLPNTCYQFLNPETEDMPGAELILPNTELSEDCLYLNVWTPDTKTESPRAVMVWIYGGGFIFGSSTSKMYDGKKLAAEYDVVVVSMQYRVGPLGFLFLDHEEAPGNMGLLDQQLALKWVASNIRSFGGDPDRVTLFGESAGAASVGYQLLSPGSAPLFKNAILQSGAPQSSWAYAEPLAAEKTSKNYAREAGCNQTTTEEMIACLKSTDVEKMGGLWETFRPTKDGFFVHDSVPSLVSKGEYKQTDIMIGVTSMEMAAIIPLLFPHLLSLNDSNADGFTKEGFLEVITTTLSQSYTEAAADEFVEAVTRTYSKSYSDKVVEAAAKFEYENMEMENYFKAAADFVGDPMLTCGAVGFADSYAERGNNVYMYYLDHRPYLEAYRFTPPWMGCVHGLDIFYLFNSEAFNEEDDVLRKRMQGYWVNFAQTGNPNDAGETTWPTYSSPDNTYRVLDLKPNHVKNNILTRRCAFWNKLVPELTKLRNQETCDCHYGGPDPSEVSEKTP